MHDRFCWHCALHIFCPPPIHHLMHILPRMDMEHHQSCADCLVTGVNNINHKSNIWEY
jgi:hypothetical protein